MGGTVRRSGQAEVGGTVVPRVVVGGAVRDTVGGAVCGTMGGAVDDAVGGTVRSSGRAEVDGTVRSVGGGGVVRWVTRWVVRCVIVDGPRWMGCAMGCAVSDTVGGTARHSGRAAVGIARYGSRSTRRRCQSSYLARSARELEIPKMRVPGERRVEIRTMCRRKTKTTSAVAASPPQASRWPSRRAATAGAALAIVDHWTGWPTSTRALLRVGVARNVRSSRRNRVTPHSRGSSRISTRTSAAAAAVASFKTHILKIMYHLMCTRTFKVQHAVDRADLACECGKRRWPVGCPHHRFYQGDAVESALAVLRQRRLRRQRYGPAQSTAHQLRPRCVTAAIMWICFPGSILVPVSGLRSAQANWRRAPPLSPPSPPPLHSLGCAAGTVAGQSTSHHCCPPPWHIQCGHPLHQLLPTHVGCNDLVCPGPIAITPAFAA